MKIFGLAMLSKIVLASAKMVFLSSKILSRMVKMEYGVTQSGGNSNALQFFAGGKLAKVEERLQD